VTVSKMNAEGSFSPSETGTIRRLSTIRPKFHMLALSADTV
jgi:hypothetical protein